MLIPRAVVETAVVDAAQRRERAQLLAAVVVVTHPGLSDVVVTVLEVRGDQVRIGIDAPRSVSVHHRGPRRPPPERRPR